MFIIFGSRTIKSRIEGAMPLVNQCPNCRGTLYKTEYTRFFTLFFLPIFPIDSGQTCYRCDNCGNAYEVNENPRPIYVQNMPQTEAVGVQPVSKVVETPMVDVDERTKEEIRNMNRTEAISFCREKYDLSIKDAKALIASFTA